MFTACGLSQLIFIALVIRLQKKSLLSFESYYKECIGFSHASAKSATEMRPKNAFSPLILSNRHRKQTRRTQMSAVPLLFENKHMIRGTPRYFLGSGAKVIYINVHLGLSVSTFSS
jgi:hypothetical protein